MPVGVKNFLIEGVSCSGKTSVCNELARRGYHAVNGDNELAYWGDPETGEPSLVKAFEHWIWDLEKVSALVADKSQPFTFLCGGNRNHRRFVDRLDGVFILQIDSSTLEQRLSRRSADDWSGSPGVAEAGAREQQASGAGLPENGTPIDATVPLAQVVDVILEHARHGGACR